MISRSLRVGIGNMPLLTETQVRTIRSPVNNIGRCASSANIHMRMVRGCGAIGQLHRSGTR